MGAVIVFMDSLVFLIKQYWPTVEFIASGITQLDQQKTSRQTEGPRLDTSLLTQLQFLMYY